MSARRPFSFLSNAWLVSGLSVATLAVLAVLLWSPWNRAGVSAQRPLLFYCAEGMTGPVKQIAKEYEQAYGVRIQALYDGSGKLLSTITAARGKGDLYLAADSSHIKEARQAGLVRETIPVAIVRPVLVVSKPTQAELKDKPVTSLSDLLRTDLKVILANPELASIGTISEQVLTSAGFWTALEQERTSGRTARISHVGTVNQVAQHVGSTIKSIGIVWDAVADQDPRLVRIASPELAAVSERVWIGILSRSTQPAAALQFARYLTAKDKGLEIFKQHRFTPVEGDRWVEYPEIVLSAGAMLRPGIERAISRFEAREGVKVKTNYAGCGLLASQMEAIMNGSAPGRFPDAYLACDESFLDDVMRWFDPQSRIVLSRNDIVLIVPKGNPKKIRSLQDLKRPDLKRIGLAHPTHSALGKLTVELLEDNEFTEKDYDPRWNPRVTHADAGDKLVSQIDSLDAALVYRSNAWSSTLPLEILDVPGGQGRASQPFAIARQTEHRQLVERLLESLRAAAADFRSSGFTWINKP